MVQVLLLLMDIKYENESFDAVYTNLEIMSSDAEDLRITIIEDRKGLDIKTNLKFSKSSELH